MDNYIQIKSALPSISIREYDRAGRYSSRLVTRNSGTLIKRDQVLPGARTVDSVFTHQRAVVIDERHSAAKVSEHDRHTFA